MPQWLDFEKLLINTCCRTSVRVVFSALCSMRFQSLETLNFGFNAAGDKVLMNTFKAKFLWRSNVKKTSYLERLGANSVET